MNGPSLGRRDFEVVNNQAIIGSSECMGMNAPTGHDFIRELDAVRTHYALTSVREGAVMVQVTLPGERWEVEVFDDREPEVFRGDGAILGAEKLAELREKAKV